MTYTSISSPEVREKSERVQKKLVMAEKAAILFSILKILKIIETYFNYSANIHQIFKKKNRLTRSLKIKYRNWLYVSLDLRIYLSSADLNFKKLSATI